MSIGGGGELVRPAVIVGFGLVFLSLPLGRRIVFLLFALAVAALFFLPRRHPRPWHLHH
jgi:hypothetical protein